MNHLAGHDDPSSSRRGLAYALTAYGLWGLIALYFKAVDHVAPPEVLAHRIVWSFLVLAGVLAVRGGWGEVWRGLGNRRAVAMLAASTLLIAVNWLTFIYAVASRQVLQSSLGYFINPLVNVLFGVALLRERLRGRQWLSIALAAAGVAFFTIAVGALPWLSLVLASTFGLYGLLRKTMPVGGLVGLTVETLLLAPLALAYLVWRSATHHSTAADPGTYGLLAMSGVVTTVPLLAFIAAARRLRLSTLGMVQYLTPTITFLLAVFAFREPFTNIQLVTFACIWFALAIYAADSYHARKHRQFELVEPD